jgi:hypothetical protein
LEFGVHLPLVSFAGEHRSLDALLAFTETARDLGYTHLCANDHLLWPLADERAQLEVFRERVAPLIDGER